jgi:hypothetical protein
VGSLPRGEGWDHTVWPVPELARPDRRTMLSGAGVRAKLKQVDRAGLRDRRRLSAGVGNRDKRNTRMATQARVKRRLRGRLLPLGLGVILATGAWIYFMGSGAHEPLTSGEVTQLSSTIGIAFPPSTRAIHTFVEADAEVVSFLIKAEFDTGDVRDPNAAWWVVPGSEVSRLPFAFDGGSFSAPQWFDPRPVRPNDVRFTKRFTLRNVSTTADGLLRVGSGGSTLYLDGMMRREAFPPGLLSALQKYPNKNVVPVLGPRGLLAEREWTGKRLPAEVLAAAVSTLAVPTSETRTDFREWSTERQPIAKDFRLLGQFDSCLWQGGTKHVRRPGFAESSLICIRGYFLLKQGDIDRLKRDLKWVELSEADFSPAKHADAPLMSPPFLRSDELVRRLGEGMPFSIRGDAVLAPETKAIYIELEQVAK